MTTKINPHIRHEHLIHVCEANICKASQTMTVQITCKHCGSKRVVKYGTKHGIQYYMCNACNRTFAWNECTSGMRYPPDQIATAINLFYGGLSIDVIRENLKNSFGVKPSDSTVYEWVVRFTKEAVGNAKYTNIKVGSVWIADETVLKLDKGVQVWFWDVIDDDTRFLLASHMSLTRGTRDAQTLMQKAAERAGKAPRIVYTDKLAAYLDGIELTFGADTKHKQGSPFDIGNSNNLIERFHGTLKARTKVMRGMQNPETAILIMDGWLINYNFFRPHEALGNRPPGYVAQATYPFSDWKDVILASSD